MISSVLICTITHSRPVGLERLLSHLQNQVVIDGLKIEICVVDNDCTGENDAVVNKHTDKPYHINFIREPNKGIVHARNAAVEFFLQSKFEALAFIDDDEWPRDNNWLHNLLEGYTCSEADIVTSGVSIQADKSECTWVGKAMGKSLSRSGFSKKFYTNNVLIKRSVFQSIKPAYDLRFNNTGSSDLHFCIKCNNAGFKIYYTNSAPVLELFPESRATIKWFILRGFRNGSGSARALIYEQPGILVYFKLILMTVLRFLRGIFTSLLGILLFDKGRFVLGISRMASGVGTLAGIFGLQYEEYKTIHGR